MVGRVLFVVDGSLPPHDASGLADSLLPKATEVLILHVVPQLPKDWICWPAFPDLSQELADATAYVWTLREDLERLGRNVRTRVHFSPLSAGEMDQEILKFAETHLPDLICLAVARGSMVGSVVRRAAAPVLVARPATPPDETTGRKEEIPQRLERLRVQPALRLRPAASLALGEVP